MGYVYEVDWRTGRRLLCCDVCGKSGGVRRHRCDYGYCPALAACASCWRVVADERETSCYLHCKQAAAEFDALEAERASALEAGAYIFRAALNVGELVRLTFRNGAGEMVEVDAPRSVYEHCRSLRVATLADAQAEEVACCG